MVPPLLCPSLMVRRGVVTHSLGLDGASIAMLKPDSEMCWGRGNWHRVKDAVTCVYIDGAQK